MPWLAVPFSEQPFVKASMEKYKVSGIPTLVILSPDGSVVCKDGVSKIMGEEDVADFPWPERTFAEILSGATLVTKDATQPSTAAELSSRKILAFYFSAHW